jgi:glycosyltransferase involved in cell wall biosynthesis
MHYTSKQEKVEAEALGVRTKSVIIPNPVPFLDKVSEADLEEFRDRFPAIRGKRVVLFLSRFDAKKGLDLLLRAFSMIAPSNQDAVLMLAGSGNAEIEESLHWQARELHISDRIVWPGFLDGASRWTAYRAADLFVLPSYSENFGVAAAEAMAAGLPVVVTDQVGLHPDVTESGSGIVTRCDPAEIANSMEKLLSAPGMSRQMGLAGRQFANLHYSVPAVTLALESAYRVAAGQALEGDVCASW